jgi:hypothetical protein
MATFGLRQHGRRLAAVDDYRFPGNVRQRFIQHHGELTVDGIRSVEAAARQWFRLGVRHPKARLAMPSVIVDDLWREFVSQTREYAEFCAALGRVPPRAPEPATTADGRSGDLRATFRYAQQDEPGGVRPLPVLFRVDQELAVAGGRHYLADCGGRGICYELKGTICLQHLGGSGKDPGRGTWKLRRPPPPVDGFSGSGGLGGCGSGCGGGN